jgi:anti-anti-sigma regulatory factor
VVTVEGRLVASQAGQLHQLLLEAFESALPVELSISKVQEADLSFLQLLCAAHRTAVARGVAFNVSGLISAAAVLQLLRAAGAEPGLGCPEGCLWPTGRDAGVEAQG